MGVIDFHNHFYPPAYLEALRSGSSAVQVTLDEEGNPCLHYPGDYNVAVRSHRDIDYREEVVIQQGIEVQVITLTTPGTHVESKPNAAKLASLVNDAFAEIVRAKRGRFVALATLPLNDPAASVQELRRACGQRLSPSDRQHRIHAPEHRGPPDPRFRQSQNPRRQCHPAAESVARNPACGPLRSMACGRCARIEFW